MDNQDRVEKIDNYVRKLSNTKDKWKSLSIALDIADEIMKGILPKKNGWHSQLNRNSQNESALSEPLPLDVFKNQNQQTWFMTHPTIGYARVALSHFREDDCPLESRLYWFSEKNNKQKISVSTQFTDNWEDSDLTRNENYKVGIDFFLTDDTNKLMMVLTNRQKLRVMEFSDRLSNTQKQILSDKLFKIPIMIEEDIELLTQQYIHKNLWDAFKLKEVNDRFYQGIVILYNELLKELQKENEISFEDAKQFSTRLLGRLLFVWFLRKMSLINDDMGYFDTQNIDSSSYYDKRIKPLFFNILNTPIKQREGIYKKDDKTPFLNGGLFEKKINDFNEKYIKFPKDYFINLYNHFNEFNFTVDESCVDYELVAVDPEMLGQIFESLLASQNDTDKTNERNKTGSFYTPRYIVAYMCKESIRQYLYKAVDNENYNSGIDDLIDMTDAKFMEMSSLSTENLWGANTKTVASKIKNALDKMKIIDPAVGSGAFIMGMLRIISKLYDRLPFWNTSNEYMIKLGVIENNIFGVDIQPMAVEIARLRTWLALIVDDYHENRKVNPLPNLEFKFISANSLVELESKGGLQANSKLESELSEMRRKYFNATSIRSKESWKNKYDSARRQSSLFDDRRSNQLKSFDPFNNTTSATFYNSELMFGVSDGFDIVIGNPPYIHFEKMKKVDRDFYKNLNYQTYSARGDIYTLFYELGVNLLNDSGVLAYITSNKWMRAAYGKKLGNYFIQNTNPIILIDLGQDVFEHATVDTNILLLTKEKYNGKTTSITLEDKGVFNEISEKSDDIEFKINEHWIIYNSIEKSIKQKMESLGKPLKDWNIQIRRGILTGLNDAFMVNKEQRDYLISKDPKSKEIIRPVLRGRDLRRYSYSFAEQYLIVAHNGYKDNEGNIIDRIDINDYPAIKEHLDQFEPRLSKRYDQGDTPYNIRNTAYIDDFSKQKIVWSDISTLPSFCLISEEFFINNSSYMMVDMPPEIIGVLNSKLISWYFPKTAIGLGKSSRYIKQFVEKIPIPDYEKEIEFYKEIKRYIELEEYNEIDELLLRYYDLTDKEIKTVLNN